MTATDQSWRERELHFIAIGGAGMSGLALVSHRLGARVSGSDRAESTYTQRLREAGVEPRIGHHADSVPAGATVVVSTAIPPDNPELVRARERGQRVVHRGELLAEICALRRLIAIAGAHGKTTTAGMIVHALREAGAGASFLLGGELPGAGPGGAPANAGWAEGEWVVAEADESDASFLHLRPEVAVVTNVELDHHSHWSSTGELLDAFRRFAEPARGLARAAEPRLAPIAAATRTLTFALVRPAAAGRGVKPPDRLARRPAPRADGGWSFELAGAPGGPLRVELAVPGRHNVHNALAALVALELAGPGSAGLPPLAACAAALGSFRGMARRLELRGERNGARIYDDYAHHPTEVRATLEALRELPHRRLIAVFQPHLYSRTKALAPRFGAALASADEVGVLEVYPAREQPVGPLAGISGLDVARAAAERAGGRPVWWLRDLERAREVLADRVGSGDLLVTLGAGDVFELAAALVEPGDGQGARR